MLVHELLNAPHMLIECANCVASYIKIITCMLFHKVWRMFWYPLLPSLKPLDVAANENHRS